MGGKRPISTIVQMDPRRGWWSILGLMLIGVGSVVAGWTGNVGLFGDLSSNARPIAVIVGVLLVVVPGGLVISNLANRWAVLIGTERGLQLVYPFGLHRFSSRSRLDGRLDTACMTVRVTPGRRGADGQIEFAVEADEGRLHFTTGHNVVAGCEARFEEWVASRR